MISLLSQSLPTPLHKWASLRSELLWVYNGVVAPDNRKVAADHRYGYWVWLIRAGHVEVKMDGKTSKASAGQWMVSPHGNTSQEFSADARILSVHFRCQWPTGENLFEGREALIFSAKDFPRLERRANSLQYVVRRHFPKVRIDFSTQSGGLPVFLKMQQLFLQWLVDFYNVMIQNGRFLHQAGNCDGRLLRAAQCLHQSRLDAPFPENLLKGATGLGRAHLDRLYWKEFGVTTRGYWERLREEAAISSLETSPLSIKEIGYCLGFKQASHFTKWFHQRLEISPSIYRERALTLRKSGAL